MRRCRGYVVIELVISVGVTLALLGVVLAAAIAPRRSASVAAVETTLRSVIETVRRHWRGQVDYATVDTASVRALLPPAYRELANPYGGSLMIAPASWGAEANAAFDLTLTLVPPAECAELVTVLATQVDEIRVTPAGAATVVLKHGLSMPVEPTAAGAACSANSHTVVWRSL